MGTGYTVDDDSVVEVKRNDWSAQTFTPLSDFKLWWAKFKLYAIPSPLWLSVEVQETTAGKPNGVVLAESSIQLEDITQYSPGDFHRVMFSGAPVLSAGIKYALVLHPYNMRWGDKVYWRYDAGDAVYPGGNRLFSNDEGSTWTAYSNDDLMFFVWGTPPTPPPPPPPAPTNWFAISINQLVIPGGFKVTLTTDNPSHLWLYWTDYLPWTHRAAAIKRGLSVPWNSYWCFVAWQKIEQEEAGDTLVHTFVWTSWTSCQTKYFYFHGTIDGVDSPSDSPIFQKHYPYLQSFISSVKDGWLYNSSAVSYLTARDAALASAININEDWIEHGQRKLGATFMLWRALLHFDLTTFPYLHRVEHVIVELYPRQNRTPQDFFITVSPALGTSEPPVASDYRTILDQFQSFGNFPTAGQTEGFVYFPCLIHLNQDGIDYIKSNPSCHLAIVSGQDIQAIPPIDIETLNFWSSNHGGDVEPHLHLFYQSP